MAKPLLLFACACLLALSSSRADDTLLGNLNTDNGSQGLVSSSTLRAVTFTTSGTAFAISSVTFRLADYLSPGDNAIVTLNLGSASAPDALVGSFLAPASASDDPANFVFTADGDITLAADTLYWLVIGAANNTDTFSWVRAEPAVEPTGTFTFGAQKIRDAGGQWSDGDNGPHTFAITGHPVPEPAVVFLSGLGFAAILYAARRPRRRY